MKINILNKHHNKNASGVYIGRPSVLGNPFSHLKGTQAEYTCVNRDDAVEQYDIYLSDRINKDQVVTSELKRLYRILLNSGELNLICWCYPKRCHGDVIKRVLLDKLKRDGLYED